LRDHRHSVSAGLKDLAPASDLVEGTLNNVDRPPVMALKAAASVQRRSVAAFQ
jgi:hypothetical protein